MIYITGDIHGNPFSRFNSTNFPEGKKMTKNDYVIICGDFGMIFGEPNTKTKEMLNTEEYSLNWLDKKPWTTLFVDGNHENHNRLNSEFPIINFNGAKAHKIKDSIYHIMRGEVFTLEGKKFFCFGGAASHDISDGILDVEDPHWKEKAKTLVRRDQHMFRIKGLSWWPEESPSEEEMEYGIENLEKINYDVDFIITHDAPVEFKYHLGFYRNEMDDLNKYLQKIFNNCPGRTKFYCGHYHENYSFYPFTCLYDVIERIV